MQPILSDNDEAKSTEESKRSKGGWITFPFITGTLVGLTLAVGGWGTNLVVYLIEKFHVKTIQAAQIINLVSGCACVLPVVAAILADSLLGCFTVIWISSIISLLGIVLLTLTAMVDPLRPVSCEGRQSLTLCPSPTKLQFSVLYSGVALGSTGLGGTRFTIATMGANQFKNAKDQGVFFNWYVVIMYASLVTGAVMIVYIEDSISWALGFGICFVVNVVGLVIFLSGKSYYRHVKPQGSAFTRLAQVVVAAVRKRKIPVTSDVEDYYTHKEVADREVSMPTNSFRSLNHAALRTDDDIDSAGLNVRPWRLCSIQQVEDLKCLIRTVPLMLSGIFLSTRISVLSSLTVLQALKMDRHLGPHVQFPAGSVLIFVQTSTAISVAVLDRFLYPIWNKITHKIPRPLQKIGLGHIFNALGMATAALIESKRLKTVKPYDSIDHPDSSVPLWVLWLVPQLSLIGLGEAFHYPGQVTLYYQEFPKSLRSTATAMISMIIGIAYYLSSAVIDIIQRVTRWLPDDINEGRLDNVYWLLLVLGVVNLAYYLICVKFYRYQNVNEDGSSNNREEDNEDADKPLNQKEKNGRGVEV